MAVLARSLGNLFDELNARWPHRDHKTDGWIGDAAHQARQSDHNPDSRGIVHAIDIDKDGIDTGIVVGQCARMEMPTSYVIFNRWIYSRSRDFEPRRYTGSNPHTGHIHVSIQSGPTFESAQWHWGIAVPTNPADYIITPAQGEEMTDWSNYLERAGAEFYASIATVDQGILSIGNVLR